jgi:hypothetical protein
MRDKQGLFYIAIKPLERVSSTHGTAGFTRHSPVPMHVTVVAFMYNFPVEILDPVVRLVSFFAGMGREEEKKGRRGGG